MAPVVDGHAELDQPQEDVICPHCKKTFTAPLMDGAAERYRGFKCPHCKLFVPAARGARRLGPCPAPAAATRPVRSTLAALRRRGGGPPADGRGPPRAEAHTQSRSAWASGSDSSFLSVLFS